MSAVLKEFRAQQQAANTDPIKLMLSSSIYDAYDRRLEQLWREPANNNGPDNRVVPPTSDATHQRPADEQPLRQLVDGPSYRAYDDKISTAYLTAESVVWNPSGGKT